MAEPWIRVHANLLSKPVVTRCADALGISLHEAIGVLVTFWGAVSQHCVNGNIGQASARQIETWAGWTRKKGKFAAFVYEMHTDGSGRVNEWDEYQGRLETRRTTERNRLREKRATPSNGTQSVAQQDANKNATLVPAHANETIRDDTNYKSSSSGDPAEIAELPPPVWRPIEEQRLAERLTTDAGRNALTSVLSTAERKIDVVMALHALLDGMHPPVVLPVVMDAALIDYAANGLSSGRFNARHFRTFTQRAAEPVRPATNGGNPSTRSLRALDSLNRQFPETDS